jgi:hypothetical protein
LGAILGVGLVLALTATARPAGPLPRLAGPALAGPTHLHLVVSGAPPYIYDVDANRMRQVAGVITSPHSLLSVQASGNGALAAVSQACNPCAGKTITYARESEAIRIRLDGSVRRAGTGWSFAAARNSSAIWALRRGSDRTCRLRLIPPSQPSVRLPCAWLDRDTEAGMLVWTGSGQKLVDTRTGRTRAGARRLEPIHGGLALEETGEELLEEHRLSLVDLRTGERRPLKWPSILRGLDEIVVQPHGTLVAVGFGDPAYPGPAQASDVWILDTATGTFTHLPGFPAQVRLKFSSMAWASDDRLVLLLEGGGRTVLAVWRPGAPTLPVRPVALPHRTGGSDTFVPLVD